jgi:hypothetical protein
MRGRRRRSRGRRSCSSETTLARPWATNLASFYPQRHPPTLAAKSRPKSRQAELLAQIEEMRKENECILKKEEEAAAAQAAERAAAEAPRHAYLKLRHSAMHGTSPAKSFPQPPFTPLVPSAPLPHLCTSASPPPPSLPPRGTL